MSEGFAGLLTGILEIAVVGAGGLAWISLMLLAATDQPFNTVELGSSEGLTVVALVTIIYVLGVVIDRLAKNLLDELQRHRKSADEDSGVDSNSDEYKIAVMQMAQSPALFARAEYIRSRLRVARGWTFNAALLAPAWGWYAARNLPSHQEAALASGVVASLALTFGCFRAWEQLRKEGHAQVELFRKNRIPILGSPKD